MAQTYAGRQRAYPSLKTQLESWVTETEERMLAVFRMSFQDTVLNAQTTVRKGGRMRIDTGFLADSGAAEIGSLPTGESIKPPTAKPGQFTWSQDRLVAKLAELKYGDVIYYGWTANYAQYRELYDGFMEGALIQWPRIVAFNVDTLGRKLGK